MKIAIETIEERAAAASISPAALMINSVLEVDEEGGCELFEHPKLDRRG